MKLQEFCARPIHFIGIAGAGMSGLARIALSYGCTVAGSDSKESSVLDALRALGATIFIGHNAKHVHPDAIVVYSSAIAENNPELMAARERSLPILTRAEALSILMSESQSVAVAGTHGKTTTSSMLTVALQACGVDPSFAIGGTLTASGSNAHRGSGPYFVAEADESDGSFTAYHPFGAIITNIEHDHVDYFHTPEAVTRAFEDFAATISPDGFLVYCADDAGAQQLGAKSAGAISYGQRSGADLQVDSISLHAMGSHARVLWKGRKLGELELAVPGVHNVLNAAAALAAGLALGLPADHLLTGLARFQGAGRRFELKGSVAGIRVVDDYGHHPTEIAVTLAAARGYAGDGRVIALFQPHRYSRTQAFVESFARELDKADRAVVLEVYAASEAPISGVSSALIVEKMSHGEFIPNFIDATESIVADAKPGDVILTMGAGDVNSLGPIILEGLAKRFS